MEIQLAWSEWIDGGRRFIFMLACLALCFFFIAGREVYIKGYSLELSTMMDVYLTHTHTHTYKHR